MFYLMVNQAANYVAPVITSIYLMRVAGPEGYGLIAFALALIGYVNILTEFGFGFTAVRQIAVNKGNAEVINKIYSSTVISKILLTGVGVFSYLIAIIVSGLYEANFSFALLFSLIAIGQSLSPQWAFQGIEDLGLVSLVSAFTKIAGAIATILLITSSDDLYLYPLVLGSVNILVAAWMIYRLRQKHRLTLIKISIIDVAQTLKNSYQVFLANLSSSIYTISITVFLGFAAGNASVGIFSAADKVIQALKGLFYPVTQAIFPFAARKFNENPKNGYRGVIAFALPLVTLVFLISFLIYLYTDQIIHTLFGADFRESVNVLKIMLALPVLILISNISGVQILLNLGHDRIFRNVIGLGASFCIVLCVLSANALDEISASWIILSTELLISTAMSFYALKKYREFRSEPCN